MNHSRKERLACFACGLIVVLCGNSLFAQDASRKSDELAKRRVNELRSDVSKIDSDIKTLDTRLPTLKEQYQQLIQRLEAIQTMPEEKLPEKKEQEKDVRKVPFRPPIARTSEKATSLMVVCQGQRITCYNHASFIEQIKDKPITDDQLKQGLTIQVPSGDYNARIYTKMVTKGTQTFIVPTLEPLKKQGNDGETAAAAVAPGSRYQAQVANVDPKKVIIQFFVYPDSYEAFRAARDVAWKREFTVGWDPQQVGQILKLHPGRAKGL